MAAKKAVVSRKCLTCNRKAIRWGLCAQCSQAAYRHMKAGKITKAKAVELGLLLPKQERPPTNAWTKKAIAQTSK